MSQLERQMRHRDREMVPRFLVQAMFALMIGTTALVAYATWAEVPKVGVVAPSPVETSREIILRGDGAGQYVALSTSGETLAHSAVDRAGFIGVIGRAIDRERSVRGLPLDAPITVARRANGHIAILDPTSGFDVQLMGYGPDNVAAFAGLLD